MSMFTYPYIKFMALIFLIAVIGTVLLFSYMKSPETLVPEPKNTITQNDNQNVSIELISEKEYDSKNYASIWDYAPYVRIKNVTSDKDITIIYDGGSASEFTVWAEKIYDANQPELTYEIPSLPIDSATANKITKVLKPGEQTDLKGNQQYFSFAQIFATQSGLPYRDVGIDVQLQIQVVSNEGTEKINKILPTVIRIYTDLNN